MAGISVGGDRGLGRPRALLPTFFLAVAIGRPCHSGQECRHNSQIDDETLQIDSSGMIEQPRRRFAPPWEVEDNGKCFMVRDHDGQALSYAYYEIEAGRRTAANLLTRDEARRVAMYIAKLPDLLGAVRRAEGNPLARRRP